jgi:hypothetical protein
MIDLVVNLWPLWLIMLMLIVLITWDVVGEKRNNHPSWADIMKRRDDQGLNGLRPGKLVFDFDDALSPEQIVEFEKAWLEHPVGVAQGDVKFLNMKIKDNETN